MMLSLSGAKSQTAEHLSVTENPPAAGMTELREKADAGDSSAAFDLGRAYEKGNGVPQDMLKAAFWYRKAAEEGDAKAQDSLGVLYWLGAGVEKDRKQAIEWYRKAARQGDANAMFNLGVSYYNGEANIDDTLAYAWFLLASEAGSSPGRDAATRSRAEHGESGFRDACLAIGEMYEKGQDMPPSQERAIAWYKRVAEGPGHGVAAERLAGIYLSADNYNDARPWCEAAAKDKMPGGAFCLGYLYQRGLGVKQDFKAAFTWYLQGAKGGNAAATNAVIQMYENGQGTPVDHTEAIYWLLRSSNRGDKNAQAEARRLRASMSDKEWKAVRKKLRERGFDLKKVDIFLRADSAQVVGKAD